MPALYASANSLKKIVLIRKNAAARLVIAQQTNDFVHYFVFGHDRPLLSSLKIRTGNSVTGLICFSTCCHVDRCR